MQKFINMEKVILSLKPSDEELLVKRANYINQANDEIVKLKTSLFNYLQYTYSDEGDKQIILFEVPFEAVTFHNLDDKKGYEKGTHVNFHVFGIHTIRVKYLEGMLGNSFNAFAKLKIEFLWKNLLPGRVEKNGISIPYNNGFNDNNLCFAESYVFQTPEQYEAFKAIYGELKLLVQKLGIEL